MTTPVDDDHTGATVVLQNPQTGERFNLALICRATEARVRSDARRMLALDHAVFPLIHDFSVWEG